MIVRKKPVEVEAIRFSPGDNLDCPWWFEACCDSKVHFGYSPEEGVYADIETLEGVMRAHKGCYIVKGIQGELYPVKADIFEETYEIVKE